MANGKKTKGGKKDKSGETVSKKQERKTMESDGAGGLKKPLPNTATDGKQIW